MYRQSEKNCQTAICPPHDLIIWLTVRLFGAPQQISTGFASCLLCCSDVAHRRPTKLCKMFGRLLGCYIIYTFSGAVAPNRILPGAKFTLRPSLGFSYIGSVTARHCSSVRQPNFAAWYKEWNYRTFAEGATYGRAAITLGIGPHYSSSFFSR